MAQREKPSRWLGRTNTSSAEYTATMSRRSSTKRSPATSPVT